MGTELTKPCPNCGGSGHVPDSAAIGQAQMQIRNAARITLRELSDQMGISIGYLSDLEHGRPGKQWNDALIKRYNAGVNAALKLKTK